MTPVSNIQILSYILAGFYSTKWLAECSDLSKMDINSIDSLQFSASSMNEEVSNLETTTILTDYDGNIRGSQVYVDDFSKGELLINDPVSEDMSWNNSDDKKSNSKRDVIHDTWNHAEKMRYLQLHNILRGNVTPPAGNMAYLEWDTELEKLAQMWANNCKFDHGQPDEAKKYTENGVIGQNLYFGADRHGYLGLYMWYEEYHNYNLRTQYCIPETQCGHYVQMAWAESTKMGCAMAKCPHRYLVVCNYYPSALLYQQMYRVAEPCSRCKGKNVLCLKNLCITPEQCKNNPLDCQEAECNLKCHNCGRLDKETCTCECTDGWDGRDCSQLCVNKHERCGKRPGYPDERGVCSFLKYEVANTFCRKMCKTCNGMQETSNNTCCGTKLCEEGYVFDPYGKTCECVLLCPGPFCDAVPEMPNNTCNRAKLCEEGYVLDPKSCECMLLCPGPICDAMAETSNNTCNGTKLCQEGYVLDPSGKFCECVLLCPGPFCDEGKPILTLASVLGGAGSLRTFPCITIWIVVLKLIEIYLHKRT